MSFDARHRSPGTDHAATQPGSAAPGKRTRSDASPAATAPRWNALLGSLAVPRTSRPAHGVGELFGPPARASDRQIQRSGDGQPPLQPAGACLSPDAVLADLRRIAGAAEQIRGAVDPDGAASQGLAPAQGSEYTAQLRQLTHDTEVLRPVIDGCGVPDARGGLEHQLTLTQDAVLRAYQTLAVYYADQSLQAWTGADASDRAAQRHQYHHESGGLADSEDWCGMFVDAQYRAAGMTGALNMVFNSTFHVREFFLYGTGSGNSPQTIVPHGKGQPVPLVRYHQDRGALRSWLERSAIGDDVRPGDVVTLDWLGGADDDPGKTLNDTKPALDARADHIAIVRSYTPPSGNRPGVLITIDGNAYGTQKPGAASPRFDGSDPQAAIADAPGSDVSTSQYQTGSGGYSTAAPHNDGPAFNRTQMVPAGVDVYKAMTLMGRGRPSLVDFEVDHVYPGYTGVTDDADGPGGPIQSQVQRLETAGAVQGEPGRAFDAATQGVAGQVPYRDEMQQRLGADFGAVRSFVGRDLTALHAQAATRDETVVFASPSPDQETVAHELTHVLQNRQGRTGGGALSDPGDASEREARGVASAVVAGRPVSVGAAPSAAIHRQGGDALPPAVSPQNLDNYQGGGLDWNNLTYIDKSRLPSGQSPQTIREIYNFYLLRHLREQVPELCAKYGAIPPESDRTPDSVAARAQAVSGVGNVVVERMRNLMAAGDRQAAEAIRIKLFTANEHAVVDALRVGTSGRYLHQGKTTYCNIYAYDVVTAMGGYLPRVWWTKEGLDALASGATVIDKKAYDARKQRHDPDLAHVIHNDVPYAQQQDANALYAWLDEWGPRYGWRAVPTPVQAQLAANGGEIVVISATTETADRPGHITVVLAESDQLHHPDAGSTVNNDYVPLQSQAGATNFANNAGETKDIGKPGRSQWWEDPSFGFTQARMWAYRGPARATAVQAPDLVGTALPDPAPPGKGPS